MNPSMDVIETLKAVLRTLWIVVLVGTIGSMLLLLLTGHAEGITLFDGLLLVFSLLGLVLVHYSHMREINGSLSVATAGIGVLMLLGGILQRVYTLGTGDFFVDPAVLTDDHFFWLGVLFVTHSCSLLMLPPQKR